MKVADADHVKTTPADGSTAVAVHRPCAVVQGANLSTHPGRPIDRLHLHNSCIDLICP